jgi:5-formyltetrahydrofolate cyclo-ligase
MRNSLTDMETEAMSSEICARLFGLKQYKNAKVVMCYMDFRNEVKTGRIIKRCLEEGKKAALPVIAGKGLEKKIVPYFIENMETDLIKGTFGIFEPDTARLKEAEPADISLALVPGVAVGVLNEKVWDVKIFFFLFFGKLLREAPTK